MPGVIKEVKIKENGVYLDGVVPIAVNDRNVVISTAGKSNSDTLESWLVNSVGENDLNYHGVDYAGNPDMVPSIYQRLGQLELDVRSIDENQKYINIEDSVGIGPLSIGRAGTGRYEADMSTIPYTIDEAKAFGSSALGVSTIACGRGTTAIGIFNECDEKFNDVKPDPEVGRDAEGNPYYSKHAFIIGGGFEDSYSGRHNLLTVSWNGDLTVHGKASALNLSGKEKFEGKAGISLVDRKVKDAILVGKDPIQKTGLFTNQKDRSPIDDPLITLIDNKDLWIGGAGMSAKSFAGNLKTIGATNKLCLSTGYTKTAGGYEGNNDIYVCIPKKLDNNFNLVDSSATSYYDEYKLLTTKAVPDDIYTATVNLNLYRKANQKSSWDACRIKCFTLPKRGYWYLVNAKITAFVRGFNGSSANTSELDGLIFLGIHGMTINSKVYSVMQTTNSTNFSPSPNNAANVELTQLIYCDSDDEKFEIGTWARETELTYPNACTATDTIGVQVTKLEMEIINLGSKTSKALTLTDN